MKSYFLKLYRYDAWSNKRVIDTLVRQDVRDEKILSIMGHILAAQYLWLHRIEGLPPAKVKLWGEYTLDQIVHMAEEIGTRWLDFVESTDDFNRELTYRNNTN